MIGFLIIFDDDVDASMLELLPYMALGLGGASLQPHHRSLRLEALFVYRDCFLLRLMR